jgi:branched-chain amino acid transport system permease protein
MTAFYLQQLVNALTIGALYALIALGYTMVYGVLKLINFAHGEMFSGGAYFALFLLATVLATASLPPLAITIVVFASAFAFIGMVGIVVERVAYRPLRNAPRLAPLLSALGVSIFLQQLLMVLAGPQPLQFPELVERQAIVLGSVVFSNINVIVLVVAVTLMLSLQFFVQKTRFGIHLRAVAESLPTARLVGIPAGRPIFIVFFVGPALGAVAGILYGMNYGVIHYGIGTVIGLKAFTAAILGGIGSIPGAMIGGFLLGLLETFGAGLLPIITNDAVGSEFRDIFAFSVLVLVLLFRPGGILGHAYTEEDQVYKKDF